MTERGNDHGVSSFAKRANPKAGPLQWFQSFLLLCRDLFDRVGYEVEVNALFGDLQGQINRHDFAARYSKRPRPESDIRAANRIMIRPKRINLQTRIAMGLAI